MKIVAKPIEVIAYFKDNGSIRPLRFRMNDEEEVKRVVTIDRLVTVSEERLAGNAMDLFDCQGVIDGLERRFQLKYERTTKRWLLFKI